MADWRPWLDANSISNKIGELDRAYNCLRGPGVLRWLHQVSSDQSLWNRLYSVAGRFHSCQFVAQHLAVSYTEVCYRQRYVHDLLASSYGKNIPEIELGNRKTTTDSTS